MKKKKLIILLVIGILTFVIPVIYGMYYFINGVGFMYNYVHGFDAFYLAILVYSWFLWPTYIIGLLLIIIYIVMRKKEKK